jgi:hypothetical protein
MNKEDIIRMAREAGFMFCEESYKHQTNCLFYGGYAVDEQLERFAAFVEDAQARRMHEEGMVTVGHMREQIAAEREACAKVCDRMVMYGPVAEVQQRYNKAYADCRDAIRARGQS